jgi:peroxiredoxin
MMLLSSDDVSQSGLDEFRELVGQFRDALNVYEANEEGEAYARIMQEDRRPDKIARFMQLVDDERAGDPQIVDALVWVSKMTATWGSREPLMSTVGDWARRMLIRHHIEHERIGLALSGMMYLAAGSHAAEALFREALAKSPHREVQGRACYWLAMYLKDQAVWVYLLRPPADAPNLQLWIEKQWGKDAVERIKATDPGKLLEEAEGLFAQAIEQYADVATFGMKKDDNPLRVEAGKELHELRDLGIGRVAPEIVGEDAEGKPFKLSDYRGQVVLLTFSADWCGHCCAMYPQERGLLERHKDKPFVILSVNADADRETLAKLIEGGEITWRCWWDGPDRLIRREWNVSGLPVIYVLDAAGVIRHKYLRGRALDEAVDTLMEEMSIEEAQR